MPPIKLYPSTSCYLLLLLVLCVELSEASRSSSKMMAFRMRNAAALAGGGRSSSNASMRRTSTISSSSFLTSPIWTSNDPAIATTAAFVCFIPIKTKAFLSTNKSSIIHSFQLSPSTIKIISVHYLLALF